MSRKYYLKEKHQKKLSYFLLCQMKIMIAVSLAVVGMNSLLTNVHAETETYGIYKNDGKVYECEASGNSVGSKIDVKDVTYLYIAADVTEIVDVKKSNADEPKVHTVHFLGNNVQTIGDSSFYNFVYLEKILRLENQSNLTEIGNFVFGNTKLASIQILSSVSSIGNATFHKCSTLQSITVDNGNANYYSQDGVLFKKENGTNKETLLKYPEGKTGNDYTIPDGVEIINDTSFYNVSHLRNVTIPATVTDIMTQAFLKSKVENIFFENYSQLKNIEYGAFLDSALQEIKLPEGLVTIEEAAFENTLLSTINIPQSVTSIASNPFNHCINMTAINVAEGNRNYQSIDGVLYTINGDTLVSYPTAKSVHTYRIKEGVNYIGERAFRYATNTSYVVIPYSVNQISNYVFDHSLIKGVLFEGAQPFIATGAFADIPDLNLYTLNSSDAAADDELELYKAPTLTVENELAGKVGESYPIQARLNADATFKNDMSYTYTSSNSAIASVNSAGLITMHKVGTANVKVTASDPFRQVEKTIIVNVEEEVIDEGNQETPPTDPNSGETPGQQGTDNNNPSQPENNVTPNQSGNENNNPSQPESNVTPSQPTIKPQENQKEPESSNQVKTSDETMILGMIGMLLLGGIGILSLRRKES